MSGGYIRFEPALTEDHIAQAVLSARAVVALDRRLGEARVELERRDKKIAEMERWAREGEQQRRKLLDRLFAVTRLHHELEQVSCGDGCCHEGLGTCEYCGEPYPCATARAAEGDISGTAGDVE